jgi:methionine-rich copper-binding protein CopC
MYGGKGDDRLYGDYGDDVLFGEDGNDSLEGEQGSDKLYGGSGKDSLSGGSGNDSLYGGDGDDVLDGQDGADAMDGGKGADTYYVDNPADAVTDSGDDGALDTVYIAAYLGSTYVMGKGIVNGTLSAQAGQGGLAGNASDNKLEGNSQNNTLVGGGGADTLAGGGGADSIDGGEGNDTVVLSGNELDYSITTDTNKLLTYLTSKLGGEVTTVSSVEFVQFKDTLKSILSTVKGDMTAPTLSARSPGTNATNVTTGTNVSLTFSEQVQAGSGSVVLKRAGAVDSSISISDINQVIFAGNTVVINPSEELAANTAYTVEMASGVIQDLSGNAYAGLSGYSFTTQAASSTVPVANQFVGLSNVKLVKDVAGNKSTVSFSITFNSASIDGQKVNGTLLDLDYDHSKVTSARVSGAQYDSAGEATPVWQFITPNMQGATANGKIVALANTDPANPIVVGGKTLDVTLGLNQAVDSFKIGFNKQSASVVTADGVDRAVGTAADVTAVPNQSYMLKASTLHWKNLAAGTAKALTDVSFVKGSQTLKSSSAGQAVFEASTDSQASMVVGKSVAESEKAAAAAAVNLTDAIAILKMIVGLNVNASGPLSPYQVVAADYNRDGGVGLTDAIDVLKAVVGLNAPAPSWVVLEQSKVASSLTMDSYNADKDKSAGWMSSTLSVDLDKTPEIQLVGVLAGDVDGSWAG